MSAASRQLLIGPVLLTAAGIAFSITAPLIAERWHLASDRPAAVLLSYAAGIWMWLALAWLAARCCDLLLRRLAIVTRDGAPYPRLTSDLLRVVLFAGAAVTILLYVFNQPATGLVTVSSVVIAVIGFALRNVISDIFSGIALSVDHPYQIGDWIETVQGSAGRVSEITWRTTRLIDRNSFVIIIPNGLAAGQRLINYGNGESDYRITLRVPLDATLPVNRAKRILLSGALDAARHLSGLSPDVLLADYGDGASIYAVRFRVPDFGHEAACRDQVASRVLHALHCAGQTIQRNSMTLHNQRSWASAGEALISQVALFRSFDDAERAELAGRMRRLDLAAGQTVVRQGDDGDFIYVLGEGILDVDIERGEQRPIRDQIAPGEVFGEMSLLTGQPRSATVTAAMESVVYEIHREDLDPILHRRPEIAEGLAAVMAEHQSRNERQGRIPEQATRATQGDLLARLRLLFRL